MLIFAANLTPLQRAFALTSPTINNYWPLPNTGSNQSYWWKYTWVRGSASPPDCTTTGQSAAISATYFNDGAFGDTTSNSTDLLSINFFKSDRCAYWLPGQDKILRWYADDYITSNTPIKTLSGLTLSRLQFLAFRGHSEWAPDRSGNTVFRHPDGSTQAVNGRYTQYVNQTFTWRAGFKYKYTGGDHTLFPNYAVLPRQPINANVFVSSLSDETSDYTNINDLARFWRYTPAPTYEDGWNNQRAGSEIPGTSFDFEWGMWMRTTTLTYQGKPVYYVGFSETNPGQRGACEDWWFAKDIGPIYIAAYSNGDGSTYAECKQNLAVFNGSAVNNPESIVNKPTLGGYLRLDTYCVQSGCTVTY